MAHEPDFNSTYIIHARDLIDLYSNLATTNRKDTPSTELKASLDQLETLIHTTLTSIQQEKPNG
jgi:hypothetical protein